ncbi:NUDIX hydrolase [Kribbella sp. DT2]|uniref:NUDIX hydrolase n=1 Tax=Kribbella sp. DT2 TaxID=3393427 RepID=UPI003CE6847D
MTTPKFILALREKIGHDLLWMPGITAVVLDDSSQVLLVRRADDGRWSLPAGILEPGEQPAEAIVREIHEETAVHATVDRLVRVESLPPTAYPNGDQVQYLDLCFRCHPTGGTPRVNDDESLEVGWFPLTDHPKLHPREELCISNALEDNLAPVFTTS